MNQKGVLGGLPFSTSHSTLMRSCTLFCGKQLLPSNEFKLKVETVLVVKILVFKTWKILYKKQNF